ncbi:hypothetical protein [Sorangium sp. So ce131]|uniref:hypothetical protein n=1 Tax=Sorangium sp. So ce131 TaxID=3133282 RepID=UPI003F6034EC
MSEHIEELGTSDLLRWRARCASGFSGPVIRQLARIAIRDPAHFQHEVLGVPRLELADEEWIELSDLVRGKVPLAIYERVLARCRREPVQWASGFMFTPGVHRGLPPLLDGDELDGLGAERPALRDLPMAKILAARRAGLLSIDDGALAALAMERARGSDEDWSADIPRFPAELRDAILEKARRTPRDSERANLLGWLEAHGVARAALLDIALGPIRAEGASYAVLSWVARQLSTRAAWDRHGLETLSALMSRRAFSDVGELVTLAWSEAGRSGKEVSRGFLEAIQVAFAQVLLGMAREALAADDQASAMAALSALACLDPPSRVSRAVHELRRVPGASQDVAELIAVNERLVKHSHARDASLEGFVAALHAIADAFR